MQITKNRAMFSPVLVLLFYKIILKLFESLATYHFLLKMYADPDSLAFARSVSCIAKENHWVTSDFQLFATHATHLNNFL
jgi:hypothetical protein